MTGLETPRLILRPPLTSDTLAFFGFLGDADAMQFTQHHPTMRGCRRRLAAFEWQRRRIGYAPWAVVRKQDREVIGWGGVYVDPFDRRWGPELGYAFHPATWGRGYATELALTCLAWAEQTLALPEIVAFAHPDNVASRRVLEKTGFREVRFMPEMTRVLYARQARSPPRRLISPLFVRCL